MRRHPVVLASTALVAAASLLSFGAAPAVADARLAPAGKGAALSVVASAQAASLRAAASQLAATVPVSVMNLGCGGAVAAGQVRCLGKTLGRGGRLLLNSSPTGLRPADIQSAYKLDTASTAGKGSTVAIVDAQDDPTAEADLNVYRATFGLPACTTANGCFKKVNQSGAVAPLPAPDFGWAMEISLDLDTVSATCPNCNILLVEANSPQDSDLMAAVDTAARFPNVVAISNSYGGSESATTRDLDSHLVHPGIAITAGAGDWGYGVSWPASSAYVTAVGGTTLTRASNSRGWSETVWSGTGSGCSANEPKAGWQHDSGCGNRTVADVAAVANPSTGVAVYDSYNGCPTDFVNQLLCSLLITLGLKPGAAGWLQVGGTSLGTPLIAGVYALAGNTRSTAYPNPTKYAYDNASSLFDVTSGNNGSCGGSYLCTAGVGYDGPTGLGTPNGLGAF
jgi:subtilase family serine protease